MLNIANKKMFTQKGEYLKTIECPKKISASDLEQKNEQTLYCNNCEKDIIDTQYISEKELVNILRDNKETCLKISRLNPMFRFV
jgi:hypothetical protein